MFSLRRSKSRFLATLAASASLLAGWQAVTVAQSNPGLTIFSGVERQNELSYHLDFGGNRDGRDRYRLRVPANKMEIGVAKWAVSYPDYFDQTGGKFDVDKIEVRVGDRSLPIQEVVWNKEDNVVLIYMEETIEAGQGIELVFSNVNNPRWGGTFYFECRVATPGDVPLPRYLGTWIVSIE